MASELPKDNLYKIRHSASHVLATAVLERFPEAKLAIGPPIKDGFYYDFELPDGQTFTPEILEDLEKRMAAIIKANYPFTFETMPKDKARELFKNQPYKLEIIDRIEDETVSIYTSGPFVDLCAGPHASATKKCKHFKLLKVAGAYWKGDENQPMLQRIYGTAFEKKADLDQYLHMLEEAKRRDHRKLGKELELFDFNKLSPGCVFWRPKGWIAYQELKKYFRELEKENDYEEICNPQLFSKELFEQSGHWEHYQDDLFKMEVGERIFCLKPMNCPDTMLYFGSKKRSYRELPLRVAEFGHLHRNELQGALSGATRVRGFMQDDAHIFCTEEGIEAEITNLIGLIQKTYEMLGLHYEIELSTRPDDYMGDLEVWNRAEDALRASLERGGHKYIVNEGDGAFYGPKIDIQVFDSLGRSWQCGTIQLDFQLPLRFDLKYAAADNTEKIPVVLHRAIAGSLERFFAILLEHFAGSLPTWLSPVQAIILPITDEQNDYAWNVAKSMKKQGIRVEVDDRSEKVGYKIREAELAKIPYILVVGKREAEANQVSLRDLGGQDLQTVIDEILDKIKNRTLDVDLEALGLNTPVSDLESQEIGSEMTERGY